MAVIELLAATEHGATMTEIARALEVNQASCVHMLAALTTAGVVVREPDRRYHLGPALVRPGQLAADRYPELAAARPEMAALAATFEMACFAFAAADDHARLVHYTWPPTQPPPTVRLGETVPLTPPLGMVFVAWAPEADFAHWLALSPDLDTGRAARLREQRAAIRRLGFVVEMAPPPTSQAALAQVLDDRASPHRDGQVHRLLAEDDAFLVTDLTGSRPLAVTGIAAPVFDATGRVTLGLNLVTLPASHAAADIGSIGVAVRAAADRATARIGGTTPNW